MVEEVSKDRHSLSDILYDQIWDILCKAVLFLTYIKDSAFFHCTLQILFLKRSPLADEDRIFLYFPGVIG